MSYTLMNPQPNSLKDGETALLLDDGNMVAVAVQTEAHDNHSGVVFTGSARWINEDGTDKLSPTGQPVSVGYSHSAGVPEISDLGVNGIAKEMLCCLLGESPTTRPMEVEENGEKVMKNLLLIGWASDIFNQANIRNAIKLVTTSVPGKVDAASLLGL